MNRRALLKFGAVLSWLLVTAPIRALAAVWNKPAFEASQVETALQNIGAIRLEASDAITLIAPDFAENGAIVQIEVESRIPETEAIAIVADKNPTSLIANFMFEPGTKPRIIIRIKLAESGELKAIIKAGSKFYSTAKHIDVAIGGCD